MKSPVEIIRGRIVGYDERRQELTIKAHYPDWYTLTNREYRDCNIQLLDGRQLSTKQRNFCYKLIREIANFTGNGIDQTKEALKAKFIEAEAYEGLEETFSLKDAPMSLIAAFQRYLVRFLLEYDIPTDFPLLQCVDDAQDYLYACLLNKKCCICGKPTDLHHDDAVGMGRNRDEIIHEGMEVLPLCRVHHTEVHKIGQRTFQRKYHIEKGVILDRRLCEIYGLKKKEEN